MSDIKVAIAYSRATGSSKGLLMSNPGGPGGAGLSASAGLGAQKPQLFKDFDLVADRFGLPRPPRVSRAEAAQRISPNLLSFMGESRRLSNHRIKRELRLKLRYPTVGDGVPAGVACGANG